MKGTPGHNFPKEVVFRDRYLRSPLAPFPWSWDQLSELTPPPYCRLHRDGRSGHGVSRYPRTTTASRMSQGSRKAKAPANFNAYPPFFFILWFSLLVVTELLSVATCNVWSPTCRDVLAILILVDNQIHRRLLRGLVPGVGAVPVLSRRAMVK